MLSDNLTNDSRKALNLSYNVLNLLREVKTSSGVLKAKYNYLANGTKLRVRDVGNNGFDYLGSLTYKNSSAGMQLESANFGSGVIRANVASGMEVNYFLTDHLGSVRVIVDGSGVVKERNDYYPFGAKHARGDYPQLAANRYKYNGKEEQVTGDLGYLDYGWRMHDKALGRWFSMDKLSEMMPSISGYVYGLNNPVRYRDLFGLFPDDDPIAFSIIHPGDIVVTPNGNYLRPSLGALWYYPGMNFDKDWEPDWDALERRALEASGYREAARDRFIASLAMSDNFLSSSGLNMERYTMLSSLNTGVSAVNYWNGLNQNVMEYAVRSNFKSARTWGEFKSLKPSQQAWRMNNVLGKTGATYLKTVRGLGVAGAIGTSVLSGYNAGVYYINGGSDWRVGAKFLLDVTMTAIGFAGPIGFAISTVYFITDLSTNSFGGFGLIEN